MKHVDIVFRIFTGLTALMLAIYFGWFFGWSGYVPSRDPADWGVFGDFIGGSLNPFVGLAGLYFLMKTLQQNERALKQAEGSLERMDKALKQSEEALQMNAEELKLGRNELAEARKAQQELAATEAKNLALQQGLQELNEIAEVSRYLDEEIRAIRHHEFVKDSFRATNGRIFDTPVSIATLDIGSDWIRNDTDLKRAIPLLTTLLKSVDEMERLDQQRTEIRTRLGFVQTPGAARKHYLAIDNFMSTLELMEGKNKAYGQLLQEIRLQNGLFINIRRMQNLK
jgi:hypothetical protein